MRTHSTFAALATIACLFLTGTSHAQHAVTTPTTTSNQALLRELRTAVEAALAPGLIKDAKVAVRIVDAITRVPLFSNDNAGRPFTPASNLKLFTSAAALQRLGPDATLQTTLLRRGDDLVILGSGDPAFGDPDLMERAGKTAMSPLHDFADALIQRNAQHNIRDILIIDTVFDDQTTHPSWHPANTLEWYGAPVAGVNFNDNCIDFTFTPTQPNQRATVTTVPPAAGFTLIDDAKAGPPTTTDNKELHSPTLDKRPRQHTYIVGGKVATQDGPYSKPVDDPLRFTGEALRHVLQERNVPITGQVRTLLLPGQTPSPTDQLIARHHTALQDVLRRVNSNSQNMMADALFKLAGRHLLEQQGIATPQGTWASGNDAVIDTLKQMRIDTQGLHADDGSGLSRNNRVTAHQLTDLLTHMLHDDAHRDAYLGSMAVAGTRGSLRSRLKTHKGLIFGKTGTISGVSTLSGYIFHPSGRVIAFSILHNDIQPGQANYRAQQDAAVEAIWQWLDEQPPIMDGLPRFTAPTIAP